MRKIISILLAAVLVMSLAACAPTGGSPDNTTTAGGDLAGQLLVGYGRADITPTDSVPLQGFGSTENRMSVGFWSRLYMTAVAITDPEGNTAIMISADACWLENTLAEKIRNEIEQKYGVPAENVIISASHQHSAPDMYNNAAPSGITYRNTVFAPGAVEAAGDALENRAPATVQTNTVETKNMNFVRHYIMDDGSYAGDNFGDWTKTPVKHASEVDNDLQLLKFVREGQKTTNGKDARNIIVANFQGHPHLGAGAGYYKAHSDLVGVFRDEVEAELDCQVIYFSGAGGNVNMKSQITEETTTTDYKVFGKKLAQYVMDAEGGYTDIELTAVKASKVKFTGTCNHTEDYLVSEAMRVNELYNSTGDESVFVKNGFKSKYHPGAIIAHSKLPMTKDFELFAISFGDFAFVAAPYEMFSESGEAIKEGSPFKMTMIATIANGGQEYFPTQEAWDYGCYEQYNSNYERGTAEKLVDTYVGMLKDLHGQY